MRAIFRGDDQERLIAEFFRGVHDGYFVDVGAADPEHNSQSWQLEQKGWTGVLVEPRPDCAAALRRHRRAKVYEVACTAPGNRGAKRMNVLGRYSSLNKDLVIAGMPAQGAIEVEARTLDEILIDAQAPTPIDFISIDVEGHELEVLEGLDLTRWRPRLLLVEDHLRDLRLHRAIETRGYKWVRRTDLNAWYLPADAPMAVGWFGRLQFVRKYYLSMPVRRLRDALRRVRAALGRPPQRPG